MTETRSEEDDFIIIACDGIWDVKTSSEACDFVRKRLLKGLAIPSIVEELMDNCLCKDPKAAAGIGADNMTAVIVQLRPANRFTTIEEDAPVKSCLPFLCGKSGK